jgi:hypothetical protein
VVELQNKPRQINARIRISDLMLDIVIEGWSIELFADMLRNKWPMPLLLYIYIYMYDERSWWLYLRPLSVQCRNDNQNTVHKHTPYFFIVYATKSLYPYNTIIILCFTWCIMEKDYPYQISWDQTKSNIVNSDLLQILTFLR